MACGKTGHRRDPRLTPWSEAFAVNGEALGRRRTGRRTSAQRGPRVLKSPADFPFIASQNAPGDNDPPHAGTHLRAAAV
jgi:hypothetical protein